MKLKKFFAGVVAAAMMLTMGATAAFAAGDADAAATTPAAASTGTVLVANDGTFTFNKKLTVNENDADIKVPTTFNVTFTVTPENDLSKANPTLLPTIAPVDVTNGAGKITVDLPLYTDVGVYTYTIAEGDPTTAGVNKNSKTYLLTVFVINKNTDKNGATGLECKVSIKDGDDKASEIENTYDAGKLEITKLVSGAMGNRNEDFTFTVEFSSDKPINSVMKFVSDNAVLKSGVNNGDVVLSDDEKSATVVFTVKHGQTAKFFNVPNGVSYTIKETYADGYTTYIDGKETSASEDANGNKYIETTRAMDIKEATKYTDKVEYNNEKGGDINTGVILDNAPYIALMAIVVFGGVALMLNKRRRDEE